MLIPGIATESSAGSTNDRFASCVITRALRTQAALCGNMLQIHLPQYVSLFPRGGMQRSGVFIQETNAGAVWMAMQRLGKLKAWHCGRRYSLAQSFPG